MASARWSREPSQRAGRHGRAGRLRAAARHLGRAARLPFAATARGVRRATRAQGAGESGLGELVELHAVNGAGDVMITVALASTVFFSVPTDEARGRVALYLAVTLAPFTLLAPVVGPLLDRLPHGRRAAMAGAMLARALLALVLSGAVAAGDPELYPAALGVLVASRAYGVVRSAVVPRLLPPRFSLVRANSRVTLAGLLATGAAAPAAVGLHRIGPQWPLYGACALFAAGTFLAFTLPHAVDSARGEREARILAHGERRPGLRTVGPAVLHALQANAALRALSGFLVFFLAFLLRVHPIGGQSAAVSLAAVGVAAGAGNACGTAVGAWLRDRAPEAIIATMLALALAVTVLTAVLFGGPLVVLLGAVAGLAQALSKLSLDALIQRDVPESVRTSAFARSETLLQTAWVAGGAAGIVLPLDGGLGTAAAAAVLAAGSAVAGRGLLRAVRHGEGASREPRAVRNPGRAG
ncbi:MFS transporter [Streptomyces somaliensis DSM 40738]|uniref:MFS transporter n=1 Tax=Streptomyces somaliensis (strain ATCC 33201 / DSM 40738 / JCM 12659 / KCTC 9044 / NCTC 11332 / NRRL B-12077 / IP 733) TaxID=1134445 RepID=A0AA44DE95_STRE0|nr:MFS transporter [Streptomyces somaliensis]MCQ0023267.1 MFS transporter [Streptomyces somaliensis DSM 40738]NKY15182.1 MFS transporter [Streptomyces somaliensis DSM 40738]